MTIGQIQLNAASRLLIDVAVVAVALVFPVGVIVRCLRRVRRVLRDGVVYDSPDLEIRRANNPSSFWFIVAANVSLIALCLAVLLLVTAIAVQMILLRMILRG